MNAFVSLEEAGYRADRLEAVRRFFHELVQEKITDGFMFCLSRDGHVFAHEAGGRLSYEKSDPRVIAPDTIFPIASITKLFTAVAIGQLVDDGKLYMGQAVSSILPEFNAEPFGAITIADLLTHSSGIAPDGGTVKDAYYKSAWWYIENTGLGKENWIKAGLSYGLRFPTGTQWMYASFGYAVLGEIITRVTGVFAHDYIMEHIVKPLEMEDTFFDIPHEKAERVLVHWPHIKEIVERHIKGEPEKESVRDKMPDTGGGLFSTALDLQKFGSMLLHKGRYKDTHILSRAMVEKMTKRFNTDKLPNYAWGATGEDRAYGLGPDMRYNVSTTYSEKTFFHEGAGGCALMVDPVERLVALWVFPFHDDVWNGRAIFAAQNVIWSGLE